MNPEPQLVHHLIYKPKRPKPLAMIGAGQQEMYHLQLISKIDEADWEQRRREKDSGAKEKGKGKEVEDVVMVDLQGEDKDHEEQLYAIKRQKWTIQLLDFPEASPKPAETRRGMYTAEAGDGDVLAFMEDFGYT